MRLRDPASDDEVSCFNKAGEMSPFQGLPVSRMFGAGRWLCLS